MYYLSECPRVKNPGVAYWVGWAQLRLQSSEALTGAGLLSNSKVARSIAIDQLPQLLTGCRQEASVLTVEIPPRGYLCVLMI